VKITELRSENVKRLKAVTITPSDDGVTIVGGRNGAGKSSALDSILYALAGKNALPPQVLREGEEKGEIELDLNGDPDGKFPPMTVRRTFTEGGGGSLTIKTAEGFQVPKPQSVLDGLRARFIDPLAFTRMPREKQVELLREVAGIDTSIVDAEIERLYELRRERNREFKAAEGRRGDSVPYDGMPAEEVSVQQLAEKLGEAQKANAENDRMRRECDRLKEDLAGKRQTVDDMHAEIVGLEDKLRMLRREYAERDEQFKAAAVRWDAAQKQADSLEDIDTNRLTREIAEAERINSRVRHNNLLAELDAAVEEAEDAVTVSDAELSLARKSKQEAMEKADWPVDGLGFGEEGLTFNGLPFEQASSAEQLRVSVAMGFALNPRLPVLLIRDGSLLDDDNLALIRELTEAHDGQVFVERVGDGEECSVVIEDGEVMG